MYYSVGDGKTVDAQCWIGLYRSKPGKSITYHYWLDGNRSTYRKWADGEPGNNQCVLIDNGKFRDAPCTWKRHYICKGVYLFSKAVFR